MIHLTNDKAFSDLFNDLFPQLCFYAGSIVSDQEEAKDIVIDAFTTMWQKGDDFESLDNIRAYLFTITRNKALNFLRSNSRACKRNKAYAAIQEEGMTIEQAMIYTEVLKELSLKIAKLTVKYRRIYDLTVSGLTVGEIAKLLNCSADLVSQQKKRMIEQLKTF